MVQNVLTAILALCGAKLATIGTGLLINRLWMALPTFPAHLMELSIASIPTIMAAAACIGWALARRRPTSSLGAVVVGLGIFVMLPLLTLLGDRNWLDALLACASSIPIALCFAVPFARSAGFLKTGGDGLVCGSVVCVFLPLAVWWTVSGIQVRPIATSSASSGISAFVPIAVDLKTAEGRLAAATPPPPSGPSFEAILVQAIREGRVPGDPKLQALRTAVVSGSDALRAVPCDPVARSRFRIAVLNYLSDMPALFDRPNVEMFTSAGQTHQISAMLNAPANAAVLDALRSEVVVNNDLPRWRQMVFRVEKNLPAPDLVSPLRCR